MIPIDLFDGINDSFELKVVKYVNQNLKEIVEVYIDYLNENDGFDINEKLIEVLPRDYIARKPEECRRLVDELYEIISSPVVRDYIKPKYEFILYQIMEWWMDICDSEEQYIPIKLNSKFIEEIKTCEAYKSEEEETNFILLQLLDFKNYLYFCFYDHDFLPDSLEGLVTIYLRSPSILKGMFPDVDLDEYIDLMPVDLRELYIESKNDEEILKKNSLGANGIEKDIITELYSAIALIQNNLIELVNKNEVEISNEIFRMTKRVFKTKFNIEIEREAQIGRAKVKIGETDFALYINDRCYQNIAIIENKLIEEFLEQYGQLLGYLNTSFKFGITISINKEKNMETAFKYVLDKLKSINDIDFPVVNIDTNPFGEEFNYIIKSEHKLPEDVERIMPIYHLILNLYDDSRKKIAEKSRKRN